MKRDISVIVPVYIASTTLGYVGYTFNSSSTAATGTFSTQIAPSLAASGEFVTLSQSYSLFCIDGVSLKVYNTQVNASASTFNSYPAIALDIAPYITGSITKNYAADSDTNLEISVNNTSQSITKSYPMNHHIVLSGGYPVGGKDLFFVPGNYGASNGLYLMVGYKSSPTNGSTQVLQVLEVEFTAHCRFAKPIRTV